MSALTFEQFLRALGLRPKSVVADGKWHRCATEAYPRRRNGTYKLMPDLRAGLARDFSIMTETARWRADHAEEIAVFDPDQLAEARSEASRAERDRLQQASGAALRHYLYCQPIRRVHPYLESHGLTMLGTDRLRVDSMGWLVVPASVGTRLVSVQSISAKGEKRYWSGAQMAGASFTIEHKHATLTVFCEGLATALAIYHAVPESRVVCCFDSGNLSRITQRPLGLVVIAADNDHGTEQRIGKNPGLDAARRAQEATGAGIAVPEGIEGTDWCDYRLERFRARWGRRREFDSDHRIQAGVDSEIRLAVTRAAIYVPSPYADNPDASLDAALHS